jgi:tight adherence protein B
MRSSRSRRITTGLVALVVSLASAPVAGSNAGAVTVPVIELAAEAGSTYPQVGLVMTLPPSVPSGTLDASHVAVTVGEEPATSLVVSPVRGEEVEVVVVVDTSGSMQGEPLEAAKAAAGTFLDQVAAGTRVGVVGFGDHVSVAVAPTTDLEGVRAVIGSLTAEGETALYDAVAAAVGLFPADQPARRHVVVLSDGGDTASTTSLYDAVARVTASGATLDTVGLASDESNEDALRQLSLSGHGTFAQAADPGALAGIYQGLGRQLANQYRLTFTTDAHGSATVSVTVDQGAGIVAAGLVQLQFPAAPPAAPTTTVAPTTTAARPRAAAVLVQPAADHTSGARWLLLVGAGAWFVALAGGGLLVALPSRRSLLASSRPARNPHGGPAGAGFGRSLAGLTGLTGLADSALERKGRRARLNTALERAGIELRPGEFLVLVAGIAAATFLLLSLVLGAPAGLIGGALALFGARLSVQVRARRRQKAFTAQLADALQMMGNALRTGYAVTQAMNLVATEAEAPIRDEFRRVLLEIRLGRDVSQALRAMADRQQGDDVRWLVQAMEINREVGGDLAEVLDNVATTVRERTQLQRHVQAVSAEGRLSAYVLVALPIVLSAGLAAINPTYFSTLTHGIGLVLVGVGAVMLTIGSVILNRMVKIDL